MTLPALAADLVAIVIRGDFRPVEISPKQLYEQKLIGDLEYRDAVIELRVPGEAAAFEAGWLTCQANAESLQLMTDQEVEYERLRDLAIAVLLSAPDRKISQLGINRHIHFPVPDTDIYDSIGDNLVHNDIWKDILIAPGMRSAIFWGERDDRYAGRVQIQVEPSFSVTPGVYFSYNDHYDLTRVEKQPSNRSEARALGRSESTSLEAEKNAVGIEILTDNWQSFLERTTKAIERVWQQGRQR
jgi:hypothetical protein